MTKLFALAALVAATMAYSPVTLAVDNTITPYCRGDAAKDHAPFCAAVAQNGSMASQTGNVCAPGYSKPEYDPEAGYCVPNT